MTRPGNRSTAKAGIEPRSAALEADTLTTGPRKRSSEAVAAAAADTVVVIVAVASVYVLLLVSVFVHAFAVIAVMAVLVKMVVELSCCDIVTIFFIHFEILEVLGDGFVCLFVC